jgi:hypothetical protein
MLNNIEDELLDLGINDLSNKIEIYPKVRGSINILFKMIN